MSKTPFDAMVGSTLEFPGCEQLDAALKALPESELGLPLSLYIEAVQQAPVAISVTDRKANILYVNEAFTRVTGYTAIEIIGQNESKLSDKTTPRKVYYELWHTISRKTVWHGQLINRRKQGERYLADLTIAPMLDDKGNISHYIGMHRDISEAHHTEQQLANQKQLIESVINSSPVAMAVLDSEQRIVLDNQMYKMLISELGYTEPALFFIEALQQDLGDFWSNKTPNLRPFNNHEVRVEGCGKRGPRWFACSGNWFSETAVGTDNFFEQHTHDYLLLSINDITQQRLQQERLQLQTLQNILAEEEHIRSIRETLLGAMHQIGQPLNQINAALQLMQQRNDERNLPLQDLLQQMHEMGEQTLTTLRRCIPDIPESTILPVNLNQLLHEVIRLYGQKFLANGVVLDWRPNPVLPSVLGAENKLRMLFKLLLDNAINALNRPGGHDRVINIITVAEQGWVKISIADSGPGIPGHLQHKVFEPFFSLDNGNRTQSGMGLVMAKEIVDQHHGLIEIDPNCHSGCCVSLAFPVCPKNSKAVNDYE